MENLQIRRFADLEACYGQLMSWCDLLEAIADFLPCHLDERLCDTLTNGLIPLLQATHRLEEQVLSQGLHYILAAAERSEAEEHRRRERISDLESAREVVDVLTSLKDGRCRLSWDAIGYLLRSFFCAMRKHIQAERQFILLIKKAMNQRQIAVVDISAAAVEAA
ncbi:hypothetical protein FZ934_20385 (plasmid) [Rhizobium grahamii]|uniref:Hemerythrin-like domain-containing protein n=1 Tax=Rhizobium grahamii TaxID=1120045 RepID=A0A5Q0CBC5_9HYPH|nr:MULTISPECIES: hypothetical protein [Rhizobium]QFY62733.1 hypothetical protein FZ934_20385 [Rhizobium grahamii]QRM52520.1 hypothetical protein F3Y33_25275 [Rhizobium sp. BG6]